jgi:rubredoxin
VSEPTECPVCGALYDPALWECPYCEAARGDAVDRKIDQIKDDR